MNRYRQFGALDDVPEVIGDGAIQRLDMRTDSATLPAGTAQVSENFRFDSQGARVRGGISRQLAPGTTIDTIRWVGIYRPDGSNDRLALVTQDNLLLFNPATQAVSTYAYPGGQTVASTDAVDVLQLGTTAGTTRYLKILRGLSKDPLSFDGAAVTVDTDFEPGEFGIFTQSRVLVNSSSQEVKVSDYLAYSQAAGNWNLLQQFRIRKGGDDFLIGFLEWQKDYVIIGTRKGFVIAYLAPAVGATGYSGGLVPLDSFVRNLTRAAGLVGRHAWGEASGLVWFLSDRGIFAFQPRLDLELTQIGDPISRGIQPIMDRLSANYATGAQFAVNGSRLYFAMPINGEPLRVSDIAVANGPPNVATVTTMDENGDAVAHGLAAGDLVQIQGALDSGLNGVKTVATVPSETTFTYETTASNGATVGVRVTATYVAQRNNRIAVFNTALASSANPLGEWESVDTLPYGLFADHLRIADFGSQRRLWIIDRVSGPALYEEGDVDELGSTTGGALLSFTLPQLLTAANYQATPIPGRLRSRTFRWGGFARHVRAGEARLTVAPGDAGTLALTVRTPDLATYEATRTFDGNGQADTAARKRCGRRGLEAELEINTTAGRPLVRTLTVEMTAAGRVAEE